MHSESLMFEPSKMRRSMRISRDDYRARTSRKRPRDLEFTPRPQESRAERRYGFRIEEE